MSQLRPISPGMRIAARVAGSRLPLQWFCWYERERVVDGQAVGWEVYLERAHDSGRPPTSGWYLRNQVELVKVLDPGREYGRLLDRYRRALQLIEREQEMLDAYEQGPALQQVEDLRAARESTADEYADELRRARELAERTQRADRGV